MARRRLHGGPKRWPGSLLREVVKIRSPAELIEDLAVPHRARASFWRLMELGPQVSGVVRAGLRHPEASVRAHCCEFLDHYLEEAAYEDLLACLEDGDARVRFMAGHALTCERCKADAWHPPPEARDIVARARERGEKVG